jgi:hypothetical protein
MHSPIRNWLIWVNSNIILELGSVTMNEKRLGVLLRIATNMLDKAPVDDNIVRIEILSNLRRNVWKEYFNIYSEDLPF